MAGKGIGLGRGWLWKLALSIFILLIPAPILLLLVFRFLPIPGTPEMLVSLVRGKGAAHAWTDDISPRLERAVIGAEDQNFCTHNGFDWDSINKAMEDHKRHPNKAMRGASTLSQQTARTLFLVPMRSWIRKGLEAYLTVLVEGLWPKKRILHAYLNLVDWGDGIFGNRCRLADQRTGRPAGRHPAQSPQMEGGASGPLCAPAHRHAAGPRGDGDARRAELLR
jgi:monofunctional biosynthetic peptidoglycan transglycosylase